MFPLISGLISGGASLLGNLFSSNTSAQNTQATIAANQASQQEAEGFNANQAAINRDFQAGQVKQQEDYQTQSIGAQEQFQQQMSNTAYQRASQDMKAAGLNPMMMFGSGSAASTPSGASSSGSSASGSSPSISPMKYDYSGRSSPLAGLGASVTQALNSAVTAKTVDKMTDEIANLQATQGYIKANTNLTEQKTASEIYNTDIRGREVTSARVREKMADDMLRMPDWLRSAAVQGGFLGNKASDVLAPIVSSAGAIRRFLPVRSTSETTRDDGSSSFSERFNNIYGHSE